MCDVRRRCRLFRFAVAALVLCCALLAATATLPDQSHKVKKKATDAKRIKPADNSYCFACHANFKKEDLAETHRKAGIGCAKCHGESDKHSSDENNMTPPDRMYAKDKIVAACLTCHKAPTLRKSDARLHKSNHSPLLQPGAGSKVVCTDCHGSHRLPVRTRRWDKNTGKLLKDDGVRMIMDGKDGNGGKW